MGDEVEGTVAGYVTSAEAARALGESVDEHGACKLLIDDSGQETIGYLPKSHFTDHAALLLFPAFSWRMRAGRAVKLTVLRISSTGGIVLTLKLPPPALMTRLLMLGCCS